MTQNAQTGRFAPGAARRLTPADAENGLSVSSLAQRARDSLLNCLGTLLFLASRGTYKALKRKWA
jgi:hypothetical protein